MIVNHDRLLFSIIIYCENNFQIPWRNVSGFPDSPGNNRQKAWTSAYEECLCHRKPPHGPFWYRVNQKLYGRVNNVFLRRSNVFGQSAKLTFVPMGSIIVYIRT